jgi:methyl-accepting chemotaxis protein
MTLSPARKFPLSLKLKLGNKALICAVLVIAMNTALVVGAAYWSLSNEFRDRALRDIDVNLRTLALAFGETFKDAKLTMKDGAVSRVEISQMP